MVGENMRNPLRKRLLRELRTDFGKYFAIFLFITIMIGFVSGGWVSNTSMKISLEEGYEKYQIEDGHFVLQAEADTNLIEQLEALDLTVSPDYYIELPADSGTTLRIFRNRETINTACLMSGAFPADSDEIAIDRVYAGNNGIRVGDDMTVGGRTYHVTGFVALPDYSALFVSNTDSMFDSVAFGVSVVSEDGFAALSEEKHHYSYSWRYDERPQDDAEKKEHSEAIITLLGQNAFVESFVPEYLSQSIHFATDDIGKDKAMFVTLLYILIVIIAFAFAVTTSDTISKEATVIGTLRASGYQKSEIIRHYLSMPLLVTLLAAILGNVLGYTLFRHVVGNLYYASYSLVSYEVVWNASAFLVTTVIPLVLIAIVNFVAIARKMSLSPLALIRRDITKHKRKKAMRIPRFSFMGRFRIRVMLQNIPGFVTLFVGICLANVLLLFGVAMNPLLEYYEKEVLDNQIADYQYVLTAPVETSWLAEKYSLMSLKMTDTEDGEEISVYGLEEKSAYFGKELAADEVLISDGIRDKYGFHAGDTIRLKDRYLNEYYSFTITGVYDYPASLCIFINREAYNETFKTAEDYFTGYFADEELSDIDDAFIMSKITSEDLTKMTRQMKTSMGSTFYLFCAFAVALYLILIYMLAKVVLEKNTTSISMVKILGYNSREIRRIYLSATGIVAMGSLVLSLPVSYWILGAIYHPMMKSVMTGWLTYYVEPYVYLIMLALGVVTYYAVELILYRKIHRIPMDEALKSAE